MMTYDKLEKLPDADIEAVRQFADLKKEMEMLEGRLEYVKYLMKKNRSLNQLVWRTKEGVYMPVSDMDDNHLKNAVNLLVEKRGKPSPALRAEFLKRFKELPPQLPSPTFDEFDDVDHF